MLYPATMPTIRTTMEPWREIVVTDAEYLSLLRAGLIYDEDGPPPPPPPNFTDGQYAELADPEGEAIERILETVMAEIDETTVSDAIEASVIATITPSIEAAQTAADAAQIDADAAVALATAADLAATAAATSAAGSAAIIGVDSSGFLDPDDPADQSGALASALSAASSHPAMTLTLRPGEYVIDSTVTVPEGVTLRGIGGAALSTVGNGTMLTLSSGVTLDGVRFVGSNPVGGTATQSGQAAVSCVGTGADHISDVTIRRCRFEGLEAYGISFRYTERFVVTGNFFADIGYDAVAILCATDGLIDSNIFRGTGVLPSFSVNAYAVSLSLLSGSIDPVTNYPPARINVTNNLITNQAWEAFDTHGGDEIVFANNNIYGCEMGIAVTQKEGLVDGGPAQVTVTGNVINRGPYSQTAVRSGISVNGATEVGSTKLTGVTITGNVIKGHGVSKDHPAQAASRGGAITMSAVASAVVSGNLIIDTLGNGMSFRNSNTVTVVGNIFQTVWRETGDASRTSALIYLDSVTTATIVGNSQSIVATSLPNVNESTVRIIAGSPKIRAAGNTFELPWQAIGFSNSWVAGSVNDGVRPGSSRIEINTSFTPPGSSNASGTAIGTVPIAPAQTSRLVAVNALGFAAMLDINPAGNIVLRSTYNQSGVLFLCSSYMA